MNPLRPASRALPWTICAMAALLTVKSVTLVKAAVPGAPPQSASVVAAARAAPPPRPSEGISRLAEAAPAAKPAEPAPHATGAPSPPAPAEAPRPAAMEPPVSESERGLLLSLRQRRVEIETRETALSEREAVLSATEKRLATRLDELTALQHRLEALETARKDRDEANWHGLVKVYETMKPREAAAIFNDLDLPVLLQVVDRMKEAKTAPVLAAMLPDRARQLTAELAQFRARANTAANAPSPVAAAAPPPPSAAAPPPAPATAVPASAATPPSAAPASGATPNPASTRATIPAAVLPNAAANDGKGKT